MAMPVPICHNNVFSDLRAERGYGAGQPVTTCALIDPAKGHSLLRIESSSSPNAAWRVSEFTDKARNARCAHDSVHLTRDR
jgi:hypothetical protein